MTKHLTIVLSLQLWCVAAFGATLISDPDNTGMADKCVIQEGAAAAVESATVPIAPSTAKSCSVTLNGFAAGTHNLQVWFRSTVWGVDSAKVPFVFQKPAAGFPGPTGLTIAP